MEQAASERAQPGWTIDGKGTFESLAPQEVYRALGTSSGGLTQGEAERRLSLHGRNVIGEIRRRSLLLKLLANFTHLMALLLWAGAVVAFLAQMPQLGVAILLVNVINGTFSFWQEYKAERATEALRRLLPAYANVLRDGEPRRLLAQELVPGDVILLSEGDRISADARIVEESSLRSDQSTLTGESQQVRKTSEAVAQAGLSRLELPNLIFAGTSVTSGNGKAVVFATGMGSEFGKIAHMTQSMAEEPSPLQKEMSRVSRSVTLIAVASGGVFFLLALWLARISLAQSFIFAMGMIVAFVPEGLLPTVTLALAMGVQRMARRHALIKKLSSVETLGCTSVICTDKTGTLTQNEMTVRDLWFGGRRYSVTGVGYTPEGEIRDDGGKAVGGDAAFRLLLAAALCNNARLQPPEAASSRWTVIGDPTEAALKVAAMKAGLDPEAEAGLRRRLWEIPFESRRKRMSTIHRDHDSRMIYTKGAPREILNLCTHVWIDGGRQPMGDEWRGRVLEANDRYAREGLRVLAVAERALPGARESGSGRIDYTPDAVERDLTLLGLAAMMDPPRPEVMEAVAKCHRAGIRVIMITGDYGLTAESIARRIGIIRGGQPLVCSGADLDQMDEEALRRALQEEIVFARTAPEHKLRVVAALKDLGQVVAVTGDGVNDAPALKRADIGVAMGLTGTDVAKEAADMILTDDNFASIVNAIEEGRAVYANIKKFTAYIFTSNTPEAVPFILFALSHTRIPLALNVMHILAIDLGTDLVPALALGAEPPEPGVMERPPRNLAEHVITPSLLLRAYLWLGSIQSLAVMAAFYLQYWTNGYWGQWLDLPADGPLHDSAMAMALACVVTTQIGNLFAQRTQRVSLFRIGLFSNRLIWAGVTTELLVIVLIVYTPLLQELIGTAAFPPENWLLLFALSPLLLIADELRKAVMRRAVPGAKC